MNMRPLNLTEEKALQQEMYRIYEEQLTVWFDLIPEDRKEEALRKNRKEEEQAIMQRIMDSSEILWN